MSENKTKPTKTSVTAFLNKIKDNKLRSDCDTLIEMMQSVSKFEPVLWGTSIIGFGTYHYVYESGREGDTIVVGFSPRKQAITLYLHGGVDSVKDELTRLGKFKTGKGCLYVKRLEDVNQKVLKEIIKKSVKASGGHG